MNSPATQPRFSMPPLVATVTVRIRPSNESYQCSLHESLLKGMLKLGKRGIPAGCVSGGCGVCKVRVLEGRLMPLGPISRAHVTEYEEAQGYTLACRVAPQSSVTLEVCVQLRKPFTRHDNNRGISQPPAGSQPDQPISVPTPRIIHGDNQ